MRSPLKQFAVAAGTALSALLTASGCGTDRSPLAQNTDADTPVVVEAGQGVLTFSAPGLQPAAKRGTRVQGRVVTATIGPRGGYLQVTDDGPDRYDKLVVRLDVPKSALERDETITMEVLGSRLNELEIRFSVKDSPNGMVFSRDGTLSVKLEKTLYSPEELEGLTVEHLDDDGNLVDWVNPEVEVDQRGTVTIEIEVPSLSRYSLPPGR